MQSMNGYKIGGRDPAWWHGRVGMVKKKTLNKAGHLKGQKVSF